jgi:hypothetical protein
VPLTVSKGREISLRRGLGYACRPDGATPKLLNQLGRHERCPADIQLFGIRDT